VTDFLAEALAARAAGNVEAAYQFLVAAVRNAPSDEAWGMLGQSLHELKRYGAAAAAFARVREPDYRGLVNLGFNLHLCGRSQEAEPILGKGLELAPNEDALPWTDYGQCLLRLGDHAGAVAAAIGAVERSPDAVHRVAYALALFAVGRWAEGFAAYEARIPYKMPQMLQYPYPRWHGKRVGRLLVQAEMGIGDSLWMMRYMKDVARRVDQVIWYVHPELRRLAQTFLPMEPVVAMPAPLPEADAWTPMLSLPNVMGAEPCGAGYIVLPPHPVSWPVSWVTLRIGLAWAGGAASEEAVWRDIPLAEFLPLLEMRGIEFHSLQLGRNDIAELGLHGILIDHAAEMIDMAATAEVIAGLDLVICVDTAVAHLAGAMGKPTWLLRNAKSAPWMWPVAGERTPWYDAMRVLTRARDESWAHLMYRVRERLRDFAKGGGNA